jgi:hypothetical protein
MDFVSVKDPRDSFSFMLLDRIERLTEELDDLKKQVNELKQAQNAKRAWKLRIETIIDQSSHHISFDIRKLFKDTSELIPCILDPIAAYDNTLSGKVFLTHYIHTKQPGITTIKLYFIFDVCIELLDFYKYINDHIDGLFTLSPGQKGGLEDRRQICTIHGYFANGKMQSAKSHLWDSDLWVPLIPESIFHNI